jgi:lipopolysaccharide/colanic/teichoic acid biosynthesis glycosyltransferase
MAKLDDNDPQIIPFGKLLRKTYLDELPQFINVLFGEMSLVGPRPPIPYEVAEYIKWHNGRFDAMPGMTGLWQVSGKNKLTFQEMVRLDISYSRNLSFLRDLKILLLTPLVILSELIESLRTKIYHRLSGLRLRP